MTTKLPPGTWRLYTPEYDEDAAADDFFRKHGQPPEFILETTTGEDRGGPVVWVLALGPLIEDKGSS